MSESEVAISEKRKIVRNTLAYSIVQVVQMISAFVFMPFLIQRFGITNYGVYLLASSVTGYLGLLDFGVGTTVIKFVAQYRATDDDKQLGKLISSVLVFYTGIGVFAASFLLLFSRYGVGLFRLDSLGQGLASNLFMAAAFVALLSWPATIGGLVLSGLQEYETVSKIGVGVVLGNIAATAFVLVLGEGPVLLLLTNGAVGVVGGIVYFVFARRKLHGVAIAFSNVSRTMLKTVFSFSWAMFVTQVCSLIIYQQTDRVVLGIFVGATAVALYEAASKVQSLVAQLGGMTATAVLPAASQFDAQSRPDALRALFLRGTKYVTAFIGPVVVTIIVLAQPLLLHWLGRGFLSQVTNAQIFVAFWLLWANIQLGTVMLTGMGRVKFILGYTVAQTAANLALSLLLVQKLGVLGVILGTVTTNIAVFPFILRYILRTLDLELRRWLRDVVLPVYPILIVPVLVGVAAQFLGLTGTLLGVAVAAVLSCAAYWAVLFFLGLNSDERREVKGLVTALMSRLGIAQ